MSLQMMDERICPPVQLLSEYLHGRKRDEEADGIEHHLEGCSVCVNRLDGLLGEAHQHSPDGPTIKTAPTTLLEKLKELYIQQTIDLPTDPSAEETVTRDQPKEMILPEQMGRYQITAKLAEGGMGAVYRAYDPELDREVALKVPFFIGSPEKQELAGQRFLREARSAAKVRHANVCPIYDVGEHEGDPFVVMALVEGGTLSDRLRRDGRFDDPREAVRLIRAVAEGLQAVHDQGILHRDLKPGNVLLDADGSPLLTDFGLARTAQDEDLTASNAVVGTPAYMSPEQADPALGPVREQSDQYSLAVVLYQMLAGAPPYQGSITSILRQIGVQPPPPLDERRSDLDDRLIHIINRAMAPRAVDRFPSAGEFANALSEWVAQVNHNGDTDVTRHTPAEHTTPPRRRRPIGLPLGLMAASVALIAVILLIWRPWSGGTAPEPAPTVGTNLAQGAGGTVKLAPLQGEINARVWGQKNNPLRQDLWLQEDDALPLRPGDHLRIEARLNRPAYMYIVQIDTEGNAVPIYPWEPGNWARRPLKEEKRKEISLPEDETEKTAGGWEIGGGKPGMETMMLLARDTPLPRDVDLQSMLAELPPQKEQNLRAAVWFENGRIRPVSHSGRGTTRGFKSFDVKRIDDPVLRTQHLLRNELGKHFDYTRAVSYAYQGGEE